MHLLPITTGFRWLVLLLACGPLVYYVLSIVCALDFFSQGMEQPGEPAYAPPISILKPVRGLDREAYENFASFCRQDYPEYEVLFAVSDADDPAIPVLEQVVRDHSECRPSLLIGTPPLVNHHADDFELGNRIAARGYRVELLREPVWMVFPAEAMGAFLKHELLWSIGLRHVRPLAHLGLILTHGLPWALAAAASVHSRIFALLFVVAYLVLRFAMAWMVGVWGLKDLVVRRNLWLIPFRDALAFVVWVTSFASNRIQWRGPEFTLKKGLLIPAPSSGNSSARGLAELL